MSKRGLNIHKRKDGRWEGRFEIGRKENGCIKYRSIYGKTYGEVKANIIAAKNSQLSIYQKQRFITFREVLNLWIENNRLKSKGATVSKYQNLIESQILPDLGDIRITDITAVMINSFLQQKLESGRLDGRGGLSASYVRGIVIVIKSSIDFAVKEQMCSPLKSPILKPTIPLKDMEILSLDEQRRLEQSVSVSDDPTNLGIMISLHTGLRIGEICALKWEDIDFNQNIIKVRHTIARIRETTSSGAVSKLIIDEPKTKASVRDIPISTSLMKSIRRVRNRSVSSFVVSENSGFVSPRTYYYRYYKIIDLLGIKKINYHALRHTFATRCIEAGVDVKSLSEMLGHSSVSVTLNTYVHSSMNLKRTQLEKMDSFCK